MTDLVSYIKENTTAVLLGSSGAGKSTITNWLLGEDKQLVKDVSVIENRGRHTTTSRQLFTLPTGGFLIDTPGMRELGLVETEADDEQLVFDRINHFADQCKFRNCDHVKSEGCAVLEALENGDLSERELKNYHKLSRERSYHERKETSAADRNSSHVEKREQQKYEIAKRNRLRRGL